MACVCVWDFTWFPAYVSKAEMDGTDWEVGLDDNEAGRKEIEDFLKEHCKKWCYQLELSASGRYHYQGRFSLKSKTRLTGLVKLWKGAHFSVTSNENRTNNFYVEKTETRIDGPWKDSDKKKPLQCRWINFYNRNYAPGRSLAYELQQRLMSVQ